MCINNSLCAQCAQLIKANEPEHCNKSNQNEFSDNQKYKTVMTFILYEYDVHQKQLQ